MVPADLDGGGVAGWSYSQECLQEKYRDIYSLPDRSSFRVGTRESRPIALGSSTRAAYFQWLMGYNPVQPR